MSMVIVALIILGVVTVVSSVKLFYSFLYAHYLSALLYYLIFISALGPIIIRAIPGFDLSQLFEAYGVHVFIFAVMILGRWSLQRDELKKQVGAPTEG